MNTKVKVEFFKDTGKFYHSFQFDTIEECFEVNKIKQIAMIDTRFLNSMNYTIEVQSLTSDAWNKYLFII